MKDYFSRQNDGKGGKGNALVMRLADRWAVRGAPSGRALPRGDTNPEEEEHPQFSTSLAR
jgi:hypothetical protein